MEAKDLEVFKNERKNTTGSILQVWKIIKGTLWEIKKILIQNNCYSEEIENDSKEILTRAYMLDALFNPLQSKDNAEWDLNEFDFTQNYMTVLWNLDEIDESIENEIYYLTPSIWVFFQWQPLFLNHNYIEALWAESEASLKADIKNGIALKKYYKVWDDIKAIEAVSKLSAWEWYKNLELTTKKWKILSWNSFWSREWLEIRIWNDITEWTFNKRENNLEWFSGINLETRRFILQYASKINSLIWLNLDMKNKLIIFWILSNILDKIWNDWQFLMNITLDDKKEYEMLFNTNYAFALKRHKTEIEAKIKNQTLWSETYDEDTILLIKWLMMCLKDDGYYVADFPLKDKNGKWKIYSWLRFFIQDKDFDINRTFWIGTNAISKDNAEIRKFLNWN